MPFPVLTPQLVITDNNTGFTVQDNTGYSSPARADLGLFLMFANIKTNEVLFFLANPYAELVDSSFVWEDILKDGNYTLFYWAVHKKTGAETPALNDFVYNAGTDVFERWNGSAWVTATPNDFYTLAAQYATVIDNKHHPDYTKALNFLHRAYVNGNQRLSHEQIEELIYELSLVLKGAVLAFDAAPAEYQRIIEGYYPTVNMINSMISP
jgi:hypothetical protein